MSENSFEQFQLLPSLIETLTSHQFTTPTPIQENAIPLILEGKDIFAQAETGSGKTGAFVIPLINKGLQFIQDGQLTLTDNGIPTPWFIIVSPTRELAAQTHSVAVKFGASLGLKSACIIGGESSADQKKLTNEGVHFLVATPGRLIDLYKQKVFGLSNCKAAVMDEADRLFDMGFREDISFLLSQMPKDRQLLMFSATNNFDVLNTAYKYYSAPVEIKLNNDEVMVEHINHTLIHMSDEEKMPVLTGLLQEYETKKGHDLHAIVFCNTQYKTHLIETWLTRLMPNVTVKAISGRLAQNKRNHLIEQFRSKAIRILVSTDVAARGLDIKGVGLVINFDLPQDASNYVHRVGRTGRAGAEGRAFSFCSYEDCESLGPIENYLGKKIPVEPINEEYALIDVGTRPRIDMDNLGDDNDMNDGNFNNKRSKKDEKRPSRSSMNEKQASNPNAQNSQRNSNASGSRQDRQDNRSDNNRQEGRRNGPQRNRQQNDRNFQSHENRQNGNNEFHPRGQRNDRNHERNSDRRYEKNHNRENARENSRENEREQDRGRNTGPQKTRIFTGTATSPKELTHSALKFFNLSDDSLLEHKIIEKGRRAFFIFGPRTCKYEFKVRTNYKDLSRNFLDRIFEYADLDLKPKVDLITKDKESILKIDITGDDEALLHENDGELIYSLDHLLRRHLSQLVGVDANLRFQMNTKGEVSDNRDEKLKELAERMKAKVLSTKASVILRPMNPTERRIVHQHLDGDKQVKTISIGDGHYKKIKIDIL